VPLDYVPHHRFAEMRATIDALTFSPTGSNAAMTWAESLAANDTDGLSILHRGRVVYEWYSGCLTDAGKPAAMSMTKSTVGLLAEILIAEGRLDDAAPVTEYLPELANTAFGTATVRQVMDMTTALVFDENYLDHRAVVRRSRDDGDAPRERVELADALLAAHADDLVATIQRMLHHLLPEVPRGPDDADFHVRLMNRSTAFRQGSALSDR
jgi:CubicO group peptidase (beta-lactamase class C family)